MIMSIPLTRKMPMTIGTQIGLTLYSLGIGGVYRPDAFGVTRPVLPGAFVSLAMSWEVTDPHGYSRFVAPPRVVVIDNYDSFTYNLVQYLGELGAEVTVHRNDAVTVEALAAAAPDAIVISPGPGRPSDAGISRDVIEQLGPTIPLLGVCLGHQCIGEVFGGDVVRAPSIMHGKTSLVHHEDEGVFAGLPQPFEATRYHSLVVSPDTFPDSLEITARTADGVIMGLRHRVHPIEGVQFHPESILTNAGKQLLANFLAAHERTA